MDNATARRMFGSATLVILLLLFSSGPALAAPPAPLRHGTGYVPLGTSTSWVNGDRASVSFGTIDLSVTDISTHALIDLRYDKGLRSSPANRPSNRFVWKSRFDNENGTNVTGNALHELCVQGKLGSPAVWDCWANGLEIADAGATGEPLVAAYFQSIPSDPAQAVPMPLPGKPCGVSVQDIGGGLGLRLVNNTSPLCISATTPPVAPPVTPPATPPVTPPVTPLLPVVPPTTPPASTAACVAWWTSFEAWLAGSTTVPGVPPVDCRGVRR